MPIFVASLVVTGGSGLTLSHWRKGELIHAKKGRMRLIVVNGLSVVVPSAVFLHAVAAEGRFGRIFVGVQVIELVAAAVQITLLATNFRDGCDSPAESDRARCERAV
jgi:hypothetical protein